MKTMPDDVQTEELVATENYILWLSHEPDGEISYHLELGQVTVHLFAEEWDELLDLTHQAENSSEELTMTDNFAVSVSQEPGEETLYYLELGQATVHFVEEDWAELLELLNAGREELARRSA
jgi:hypothetical protein